MVPINSGGYPQNPDAWPGIFLLAFGTYAQNPIVAYEENNLDKDLAYDQIEHILIDSDGFTWVATSTGLGGGSPRRTDRKEPRADSRCGETRGGCQTTLTPAVREHSGNWKMELE